MLGDGLMLGNACGWVGGWDMGHGWGSKEVLGAGD